MGGIGKCNFNIDCLLCQAWLLLEAASINNPAGSKVACVFIDSLVPGVG